MSETLQIDLFTMTYDELKKCSEETVLKYLKNNIGGLKDDLLDVLHENYINSSVLLDLNKQMLTEKPYNFPPGVTIKFSQFIQELKQRTSKFLLFFII